jgi:hypothetical protein
LASGDDFDEGERMPTMSELRRVLADYDDEGVWVYQAFRPETVAVAVAKGTFGKGFGLDRMTWIKPSFGWMLHRSQYASAKRQEAIARIKVRRAGFDEILRAGVLTSFEGAAHASAEAWDRALRATEVHVQWDPDREVTGRPLERRAIQLGLRGSMVPRYVNEWIIAVEDATGLARAIQRSLAAGAELPAVPVEREVPVDAETTRRLGML